MLILKVNLLLLCSCSLTAQDNRLKKKIQENILEMFSVFAGSIAPVLLNVDCELEEGFSEQLIASQLSISTFGAHWSVNKWADYGRVFLTTEQNDRFHLGLYCSLQASGNSRSRSRNLYPALIALKNVPVPTHSFALLWIADHEFSSLSSDRRLTPFTLIYASFDRYTNELILRTTESFIVKGYNHLLGINLRLDQRPRRFDLRELSFGRSSVRNFQVKKISVEHLSGFETYVELFDPARSNVSVFVRIENFPVDAMIPKPSLSRVSSYSALQGVAVVPSVSKSAQVVFSLLRAQVWLPILGSALVATGILWGLGAEPAPTFFGLVISVVFPVRLSSYGKPTQFLMIVGTWIFLLQTIGLGFRGDIVAAIQRLPDDRVKQIHECKPITTSTRASRVKSQVPIGYVDSDYPPFFFGLVLGQFLRGFVICREAGGFGERRETLLRHVPTYRVDL